MIELTSRLARAGGYLWSVATVVLLGCGDVGPICYPVHGQVQLEGKPLAEAMVLLHPVSGQVDGSQRPVGMTGPDGHFTLTTYRANDGAPPGDYAITVEYRAQRMVGEEAVRDGRNLLPARYANPSQSQFRCQIVSGDNEIPALELHQK